jgi:uncharacterized protein (TIGR02186 family)
MIRLLAILLTLLLVVPAQAERLISGISNDTIQITSSFSGERLTFYGTIAPDIGAPARTIGGSYQVAIVILGPTQDRVSRKMTNNFGFWINTEQVEFKNFPSYFHVLSSRRLLDITDIVTLNQNYILPKPSILGAS